MAFTIVRNDITKVRADAIVNTANPEPVIGGGTDSAIYGAAGADRLLAARKEIGEIERGKAEATPAFDMKAKYILHTVGPVWEDGEHQEKEVLHDCYKNCLSLAESLSCKSIAFPMIATGVYGFPKDEALSIALEEIQTFLLTHEDMKVILVVFDRSSFVLSEKRFGGLEAFIDENYVGRKTLHEYSISTVSDAAEYEELMSEDCMVIAEPNITHFNDDSYAGLSIEEMFSEDDMTFQQKLLSFIDREGIKDSEFYKRAGITKQVFSQIRSNEDYQPKKETALASILALKLNMDEAEDLLGRAGFAFSPSSKFDVIIRYCIENKIYSIMEVNEALFKYDQKVLKI